MVGPTLNIATHALRITTGVITATSTVTGDDFQEGSFSSSVADFNLSLFGVSLLYLAPSLAADLEVGNPVNVVIELDGLEIALPAGLSNLSVSGSILVSNYGHAENGVSEGEAFSSALTLGFQNISISAVVGGLITVGTSVNGTLDVADTSAIQAVPEPSTTLLFAGALGVLALRRRR